jgi:hypothetical protein
VDGLWHNGFGFATLLESSLEWIYRKVSLWAFHEDHPIILIWDDWMIG